MTESPRPLLERASPEDTTVRGVVETVTFRNPDGSFGVIRLRGLDGRDLIVIGDVAHLEAGDPVRVTGRWEEHSRHGRQFRAVAVMPELPSTPKGIAKLLGSGIVQGIGAGLADRIVEKFGSATLDVIHDHPERLREVEGIGRERAKRIQESFRARRAEHEARAFLQAAGISPGLAQRVIKKYGDETPRIVRDDPYRLALDVAGIGFRTADRIGREVGIAPDDPRRARGAIAHLLIEASEQGHTALPAERLVASADELGVPAVRVDEAVQSLASNGGLVREFDLLYAPPLHRAEKQLASRLASIANHRPKPIDARIVHRPDVAHALASLHPRQREAIDSVLTSPLLVITGGPGTGKTTTVRALVTLLASARLTLELAAPTGRAARRLREATGHDARTIHRLLEWNPRLGRFARDAESPIAADVVLVDECSMLDVVLASKLLAAIAPGARLILVGDADQLPSVGPGTVLADVLATSWIPSVRFTEVFRQAAASAIVRGAYEVLHGRTPAWSPARTGATSPPSGELFFVRSDDPERAASLVTEMVVERIPKSFGLHPTRDVQVLVPTHRGPLGAASLNRSLQRALNPAARTLSDDPDRVARPTVGDKVMQLRNDYELDVWNGDIGTVTAMAGDTTTVLIDGREVVFRGDARDALTLAYAATVHKAQGSEYDAVVLALHTQHFILLNRPLLYTAITRARRLAVIVGSERALRIAAQNARSAARFGALGRRLAAVSKPEHLRGG